MTDEGFLRTLQETPNDDTTRLIYADWLEEQGESSLHKAEYIRLDCRLAAMPARAKGVKALKRQRQQLAEQIETGWLALVSKERIQQCRFEVERPLKWENLAEIEGSTTTRYCDSCEQPVYFCATLPEARKHAGLGHCVAVDARVPRGANDLVPLLFHRRTMGRILPSGLLPSEEV